MKGLILCGGKGTRLRPFTYSGAKHLLPVANKPVIFYIIDAMKEAGIEEIAIVVGDNEVEFREKLGNGNMWGLSFTYIKQDKPLGLAHGVKMAEGYMAGQSFAMMLGDNLIMHPIKDVIDYYEISHADCTILLSPVDHPERYGIATIKGDRVIRLIEKPKKPVGNYGIIGSYVFNNKIFEAIDKTKPSGRGELEITDAIMEMVNQGNKVNYVLNQEWWMDVGRPEDLLEANMKMLSVIKRDIKGQVDEDSKILGEVVLEEGAILKNTIIRGPVMVGREVVIQNSYMGPYTAIGDGSELIGCEVENSVILEKCILENIHSRIDMSIIGSGSIVRKRELPKSISIWAGQDSKIEIL